MNPEKKSKVRAIFNESLESANVPEKIDPEFKSRIFDTLSNNFLQELTNCLNVYLRKSGTEIQRNLADLNFKVIYAPNFPTAFYLFSSNEIYFNSIIAEKIKTILPNKEERENFLSWFFVQCMIHEILHSQVKSGHQEFSNVKHLWLKVHSGYLRSRMKMDLNFKTSKENIQHHIFNEAFTELISFLIIANLLGSGTLNFPNKNTFKDYIRMSFTNFDNIYIKYIYTIIQIIKNIASRKGLPVDIVRDSFISGYFSSQNLDSKKIKEEIRKSLPNHKTFYDLRSASSFTKGNIAINSIHDSVSDKEILEEVYSFLGL